MRLNLTNEQISAISLAYETLHQIMTKMIDNEVDKLEYTELEEINFAADVLEFIRDYHFKENRY